MNRRRPRFIHIQSTFKLGGKEARAVEMMNEWGDAYEHHVVSAEPEQLGARELIADAVPHVLMPPAIPPVAGRASAARILALGRALRDGGYDLVLTYNWGAMDAVLANRLVSRLPLVHHEDGFNEDELLRQKPARVLYRRVALPTAAALVVPSRTLERIALSTWRQPRDRVFYLPNGVDVTKFDAPPEPDAIPGLRPSGPELVVGTVAGMRVVKNLRRLVRAFARALRETKLPARLVLVGQGPDEADIRAEAAACGVADKVLLPGFLPRPHRYLGSFDVFCLSSDSEQFPISLVEAMAARLPVAATRVGDIAEIVAPGNQPFLVPPEDEAGFAHALARLMSDRDLRARLGAANRAKVAAQFTRERMIASYRSLYEAAMKGAPMLRPQAGG